VIELGSRTSIVHWGKALGNWVCAPVAARLRPEKDSGVERSETRYAWNGDIALAYQVIGNGPIDLLYVPGGVSNVDVMWDSPRYSRFLERLASFSRLIVMDRRGVGCSERFSPKEVAPLEVMVDDLMAVLDEVASERTALFGYEEANFIVCMTAATRPDRVSHAIVLSPEPTWIRDDEITWAWSHREWDTQIDRMRRLWGGRGLASELAPTALPSVVGDDRELQWLARFERLSMSPGAAVAEIRKFCETDVRGVLPSIHVPSLVLHRPDDAFVDARSPRYVADRIPDARFVEIPGRDHLPWGEETDALVEEIEEFLTGVRHAPEPGFVLATVLFTDIVGSTDRQAALGNRNWNELVGRHHALTRETLERWRGIENDTAGDGFYATFDGPARAIRAALEIVRGVRALGIEVRAGIHTGECEIVDGKHSGLTVSIGARVASNAAPSEILVSQTVKDLVAGSGLSFEERGEHVLKGVPDRWRLYRVVG
jgi:class 3 adenylate cyclase